MSDTELLEQIILYVLGPGSGLAVYAVVKWITSELADAGREPSPRTARWISYGVSLVLPSALYGLLIVLGVAAYQLATHILYVLSAFGVATLVHGQTSLPTGSQVNIKNEVMAEVLKVTPEQLTDAKEVANEAAGISK